MDVGRKNRKNCTADSRKHSVDIGWNQTAANSTKAKKILSTEREKIKKR
jgi:hypothetical protein